MLRSARLRTHRLVALLSLTWLHVAGAQGVTSAGVHGRVSGPDRAATARISVRHESTGFSAEVPVNQGRFFIQNLEPGGPYTITVRAVGYTPLQKRNVFLSLGEIRPMDFVLNRLGVVLDTVTIVATDGLRRSGAHADGGTGMTISSSDLERLPTLNRDLYDFVRLVPQISTKISLANPGLSAAGSGFRFNNFLVNGASERTLSGGVSSAFAGNKSLPLDAVREYQVLLAPYDVRYGDFAGALVNAVTRSGTNEMRGSVFVYGRNDALARTVADTILPPYERWQYGFSIGGPVVRDRMHFFIASELQHLTFPAPGPYVGQPENADREVPVSVEDLERFDSILRSHDLNAGSPGPVENRNPLRNVYGRTDIALPSINSRAVVSHNYSSSTDVAFSRAVREEFPLSSSLVKRMSTSGTTALRVHTDLNRNGGGDNELLVSLRRDRAASKAPFEQPIVRATVRSMSGTDITLASGTMETAQGSGFRASSFAVKDNITLALGPSHIVTGGAELERFRTRTGTLPVSYGSWTFNSLDDLALGVADRYEVRMNFQNPAVPLTGMQYAAYLSDRWLATDRLTVTAGLRADAVSIEGRAPYRADIDSIFGRRTDDMPRMRVELSPRLGFQWAVSEKEDHQIRGGVGIFTGRYPLAWAHIALSAYGVGGTLTCSRSGAGRGLPPVFNPDHTNPPTACLGGSTITDQFHGDVNLVDRNLRMARTLRASLAYDRELPRNLVWTNEGLFSKGLSDFIAVNLNLKDPVGTDRNGRVMYDTLAATGGSNPGLRSDFAEVIDLRNTSRNYAYSLSTRLEKKQSLGLSGFISYTWSRARDVQTLTRVNNRGTVLWGSARVVSGRHDRLEADISSNDIPHRVILAGTYARSVLAGRSELSFYYVGESGRPFTYIASGTQRRGDLNADGSNINDPIYIPTDAHDSTQIRFSGPNAQQNAFESLIERIPCMKNQRGKILERNSCREPWTNTTVASVRHAMPVARRSLEVEVQIYNFLNLLNRSWGQRRLASPALLEHVGQTSTQLETAMPVFRFNTDNPDWTTSPVESSFQLQLALRYRI